MEVFLTERKNSSLLTVSSISSTESIKLLDLVTEDVLEKVELPPSVPEKQTPVIVSAIAAVANS